MVESAEVDLGTVDVVSSTSSSIHLAWTIVGESEKSVEGFQIHYQKVASEYIQYSGTLLPKIRSYNINDLIADTYYKVCVFMFRNETQPAKQCIDTSTASWHIPVSIGSSIGAVLALSIIVMVVLLSRCPSLVKRRRKSQAESGKYDSMSSQYQDQDHYNEFSDVTGHVHDDEGFSEQEEAISADGSIRMKRLKQARSFDESETVHHAPPVCNGNHSHLSFNRASLPRMRDHHRMPVKQLSMQAECSSSMNSHHHQPVISVPKSEHVAKSDQVTVHMSDRMNSVDRASDTGTL